MQKITAAVIALVFGMAGFAAADVIDLRTNAFSGADGSASFHHDNGAGIAFTLEADPAGQVLFWDSSNLDGIGVSDPAGDPVGYEHDEVEAGETLRVVFDNPTYVNRIFLTDLFMNETRENGQVVFTERGWYSLDGGATVEFAGIQTPGSNGERWLDIGATLSMFELTAPGRITVNGVRQDHEFSLGQIDATAVPEPGTLVLLATGLLGLGALGRKRLKAKA